MIRTVIWLLAAALILLIIAPFAYISYRKRDTRPEAGPEPMTVKIIDIFVPIVAWIAGAKVECKGQENLLPEAAYYAGNHQSYFDALVALRYLGSFKPLLFKQELTKIPIASWLMLASNSVPLDRANVRKSLEAIHLLTAKLQNGISVIVFPEGTRSKGPQMGEFKAGAFKAAMKAKVPVVPFAIDDSYKCFEAQGRLKPTTIKTTILPAIRPEEYQGLTTQELSDLVQSRIAAELARMRAK